MTVFFLFCLSRTCLSFFYLFYYVFMDYLKAAFPERLEIDYEILECLGAGGDSTAFLVKGVSDEVLGVIKVYNNLGENTSANKKRIETYHEDMQLLSEILEQNPNPFNQSIKIRRNTSEIYQLHYSVAASGAIISEVSDSHLMVLTDYIPGKNFEEASTIRPVEGVPMIDSVLLEDPETKEKLRLKNEEQIALRNLWFDFVNFYLKKKLAVPADLVISPPNIKVFLDTKNKQIRIIFTDLVISLEHSYRNSV